MTALSKPSKLAIADSFSRAAVSYDQSAQLQRVIGQNLLARLPDTFQASSILDLGCGTGYFTKQLNKKFPQAALFGLDIAEGMLKQAQQSVKLNSWITGDAEQLPLKDNSIDLVFSNLALQWCHDFSAVVAEVHRVLTPQGIFLFTSLCDGTLGELKQSWLAVDNYIHVNSFNNYQYYQQLIQTSKFIIEDNQCIAETSYYPSLKLLMGDLKGIGAHNINPQRHKGLTTRQQLNTLIKAYEQYRTKQGLPATYQVIYSYLKKG
ncbi:malonyl-ACP O-methyltransferase BioC [Entomomonas asaccharolytica]|uniref:Malonyl-[acyl-carrier protein] O-methyltransferase n=1 Tax=Entomomonas asaccharolytica TaxID=2785331 RepID=A0A974NIJ2_9GAMM|nr:malonyl-ACP O-methyltransferase BioC [Entomomonas asaccharolytica]QQP87047.1 malonyl-ACP O-methyltransferase BioC [Entomomonas asaccharolytica]